jgi:FKBP-type peptidyl-prolyl cis-trans isomerase SlyD
VLYSASWGVTVDDVKITKGVRVRMKVHLAVAGGDTLEKNVVEYIHGGGTMLAGLEKILEGLEKGAKREGTLKAKEAFGNPASQPVKKIKRTEFPKDAKLDVGEKLVAKGADGLNVVMQIVKVSGDEVETRLIHPLAEKDIRYEVEVLAVTDPKPPPLPAKALKLEESEN